MGVVKFPHTMYDTYIGGKPLFPIIQIMKINYSELLQNSGFQDDQITRFLRLIQVKKARKLTQNERIFYNRLNAAARNQQIVEEQQAKVAKQAKTRMEEKVLHRFAVAELYSSEDATGELFPGEITTNTILCQEYKRHLEELNPVGDQNDIKGRFKYKAVYQELIDYVEAGLFDGARRVEFDGERFIQNLRDSLGDSYNESWSESYSQEFIRCFAFDEAHAAIFRQSVKDAFAEIGKTAWVSLRVA